MSWSPPNCSECSAPATRFIYPSLGPPGSYKLNWFCKRCQARTVEECLLGPVERQPGDCLDCGAPVGSNGVCRYCGVEQAAIVARVHAHCGAPPQLDAIHRITRQGLIRAAFSALELRLAENPEDLETLLAKARLLFDVHQLARSEIVLRRMLELGGAKHELALELLDVLMMTRRPAALDALRIIDDLLARETDPARQALILTSKGGCFAALGRSEEAERCFRRAFATDPKCLRARWKLISWLTGGREYGRALEVLRQMEVLPWLGPDTLAEIHAWQADLLNLMVENHEALLVIDRSLEHDPRNVEWLATRANILMDLGHFAATRACIGKIAELDPDGQREQALLQSLVAIDPCAAKN